MDARHPATANAVVRQVVDQVEAICFQDTIIINRPIAEVWAFLQQPNSEAVWHSGVIEEKVTSPGGLDIGATGIEVRKVFGRRMQFPWEITQFETERRVTTKSAGAPIVMRKQSKSDLTNLKSVVEALKTMGC